MARSVWLVRGVAAMMAVAGAGGLPAAALAEAPLERGIRLAEEADFSGAAEAFAEAEGAEQLSREELAALYAHRAVVRFALGEGEALRADLACLLVVDPEAELPGAAPPPLRQVLSEVRSAAPEAPEVVVDARNEGGEVSLDARAEGGPPGLVRGVRLFARPGDASSWARSDDGALMLWVTRGVQVRWYAEALGPGGVVVAREGSRAEPNVLRSGGAAPVEPAASHDPVAAVPDRVPRSDDGGGSLKWWLVGGGAAAVVVGTVVTAVALSMGGGNDDRTALSGPSLGP